MLIRNPVAKHMHKSVRASVITSKRRSLQSEATLRDAREDALNGLECSQTITFVSGSTICWDEISDMHCDALQGCLSDIGSSSILIDNCEEDEK